VSRNDRTSLFDPPMVGMPEPSLFSAPNRRPWAITTAALGAITFALCAMFFRLPEVDRVYATASDASAAMTKFQLANSTAVVAEVLGQPADPTVIAAMTAANRLDLVAFIPVYGVFLLMAGPLVIGRLDDRLTLTILVATFVGVLGDVVETSTQLRMATDPGRVPLLLNQLAFGSTLKFFGLGKAALLCAYACLREKPRHYGLAFGGVMQMIATAAAFYDPAQFGSGLSGAVGGFWVGLTIHAIQESLHGVRLWPRRAVVAASGFARKVIGLIVMSVFTAGTVHAQELEARAFSPAPIGTKIIVAGVGGQTGGILFDPSLDIDDVEADLTIGITAVGYTFGLAGRQARVLSVFPIAWGRIDGHIGSVPQHQSLNGLVDPRIKLSVALRGAPALTRPEFARAPRKTIVGASVTVMPPLGAYHEDQLINLGYNRWAIKPEIGVARTLQKWTIEGSAGVWLYTANDRYFPGAARKEQDPIGSFQGHISYALPRRSWVAFDATWFAGGASRVNGIDSPDRQRNSRLGGTVSIMTFDNHSLKITYSTPTATRRGTAFNTLNVTWQLVVF
jgi:hypothetical protein